MSKRRSNLTRNKRQMKRDVREALLMRDGDLCRWCKSKMGPPGILKTSMTIDHVIRLADGGTDDICNLVLACGECNQRRGVDDERRSRWSATPGLLTEQQLVELLA